MRFSSRGRPPSKDSANYSDHYYDMNARSMDSYNQVYDRLGCIDALLYCIDLGRGRIDDDYYENEYHRGPRDTYGHQSSRGYDYDYDEYRHAKITPRSKYQDRRGAYYYTKSGRKIYESDSSYMSSDREEKKKKKKDQTKSKKATEKKRKETKNSKQSSSDKERVKGRKKENNKTKSKGEKRDDNLTERETTMESRERVPYPDYKRNSSTELSTEVSKRVNVSNPSNPGPAYYFNGHQNMQRMNSGASFMPVASEMNKEAYIIHDKNLQHYDMIGQPELKHANDKLMVPTLIGSGDLNDTISAITMMQMGPGNAKPSILQNGEMKSFANRVRQQSQRGDVMQNNELLEAIIPPGDMDIVLSSSPYGLLVESLPKTSVARDILEVGDTIVAIDGVDITMFSARTIAKLLHKRANHSERVLHYIPVV